MDRTAKIKRRFIMAAAIVLGCALLIWVEYGLYSKNLFKYQNPLISYGLPNSYTKNGSIPNTVKFEGKTYRYNQDILPVLFLGIDKTDQREMQGVGYCADTQILAAINRKNGDIKLISIPRDTLTEVSSFYMDKKFAGMQQAQIALIHGLAQDLPVRGDLCMAGVANLFYGIPVTRYISMDIDGIIPMTDAIGGVELELIDDFRGYARGLKPGTKVTLTGEFAERYVRDRQLKRMSGLDLDRMKRQSQFAMAFLSAVKTAALNDPSKLSALIDAAKDHIKTNISFEEAVNLALTLKGTKIDAQDIITVPGENTEPDKNDYIFYVPNENELKRLVLETFFEEV